jgi:hypothetical protein
MTLTPAPLFGRQGFRRAASHVRRSAAVRGRDLDTTISRSNSAVAAAISSVFISRYLAAASRSRFICLLSVGAASRAASAAERGGRRRSRRPPERRSPEERNPALGEGRPVANELLQRMPGEASPAFDEAGPAGRTRGRSRAVLWRIPRQPQRVHQGLLRLHGPPGGQDSSSGVLRLTWSSAGDRKARRTRGMSRLPVVSACPWEIEPWLSPGCNCPCPFPAPRPVSERERLCVDPPPNSQRLSVSAKSG